MFKDLSGMFEDFGFKQVDINSLLGEDISFMKELAYEKAGNSKNSSGNRKVPACMDDESSEDEFFNWIRHFE